MTDVIPVPFFRELVPDGIPYGTFLIIEFEPQSIWYDTSFSLAVQALRNGMKVSFHTFRRRPTEIRDRLSEFGLDVRKLQEVDSLRIIDSYTVQTGIGVAERPLGGESFLTDSVKISDWSIEYAKWIKDGAKLKEADKRRLHVDDDTSVIMRYNKEDEYIDYWRTRMVLSYKLAESVLINTFATGVCSQAFYNRVESMSDGILEFKTEEREGRIVQLVRVRAMHGRKYDSRWRQLTMLENGEISLIQPA